VAVAGCGNGGHGAPPAQVRVVHGSPDAPPVDVLVDNRKVVSDLPYLDDSGYLAVAPGQRNLKVNAAGTTTTVIDVDATLMARQAYTVLAANYLAAIEPLLLEDDLSEPPAGQARLRVVHGAAGAPNVDVYITAPDAPLQQPTLTDVPFLGFSDYLTVPAGSYRVRVTPTGDSTVVIDTGPVGLAAGDVRTGIAVDTPGGGPPFSILLLADER
jgi:hypothetical protein